KVEHQTLAEATSAQSHRLRALEARIDEAQALGQVGERAARLAHSLKNTVHSVRGFAKLIEAPRKSATHRQALDGLRLAIDRLEETARDMLQSSPPESVPNRPTTPAELHRTLRDVVAEMKLLHADLRWGEQPSLGLASIALPSALLREVLLIVVQNAVE